MGKIFLMMHVEELLLKQGVNLVTIGGIVYGIHLSKFTFSVTCKQKCSEKSQVFVLQNIFLTEIIFEERGKLRLYT